MQLKKKNPRPPPEFPDPPLKNQSYLRLELKLIKLTNRLEHFYGLLNNYLKLRV